MYLHEEYIRRHGLDIPVVLYNQRTSVILRSNDLPYRWRLITISWHHPDRHPGYFEVGYTEAIHNGWEEGKLVRELSRPAYWHWDAYEPSVLNLAAAVKQTPFRAVADEEKLLAAWAVFLYMYDSWYASRADKVFQNFAYQSLRGDLTTLQRRNNYESAVGLLTGDSKIEEVWQRQLYPLSRIGSEWLVKLINE